MARTYVLFLVLFCSSSALTCGAGLHIELTHVDSKGDYTMAERVRRAVDRSRHRLASTSAGGVSAPIRSAQGEYIAECLIGNPPQRAEAIIDTGSDLVWTQCTACVPKNCFKQNLPYYNESESRSVQPVPCTDNLCLANYRHACAPDGSCVFGGSYGSGSIIGHLGTEVFTFQSGTVDLAFGCVNDSTFQPGGIDGASGIIGLGRGSLSLVSQVGASKFSYCLTPYFSDHVAPSHLFVGAAASLSEESPVMSIQFVKIPRDSPYYTRYYLPLVGMTVGEIKLPIPSTLFDLQQVGSGNWSGGVIIDSGSSISTLVDGAYKALKEELTKQLGASSLVPPPAEANGLELCLARGDAHHKVPTLVLHFSGGADMALPPENYWMQVDNFTACMAINRSEYSSSIIGNFQQQNMHLLYDLGRGQLSFQSANCSAL